MPKPRPERLGYRPGRGRKGRVPDSSERETGALFAQFENPDRLRTARLRGAGTEILDAALIHETAILHPPRLHRRRLLVHGNLPIIGQDAALVVPDFRVEPELAVIAAQDGSRRPDIMNSGKNRY